MQRRNVRARIAVGATIVAIAGAAAIAPLSASATTAPPSTEPSSSEAAAESVPAAPELDEDREALVDNVVDILAAEDVPLDRDCVAGLVAQLADADVALISAQMTTEMPDGSEATDDSAAAAGTEAATGTEAAADTTVTDSSAPMESMPMESTPTISPEAEALGEQIIYCASGDADPALVAEALALIEGSETAPEFDLRCVEAVLTTFEAETLQLIIENGLEQLTAMSAVPDPVAAPASVPDTTAAAPDTIPQEAMDEAFILLGCSQAVTVDTAEVTPAETDSVAADTLVTETTGA